MTASNDRPVGLTQDAGYQIGVRRTLDIALADAWDLLLSPEGRAAWLGAADDLDFTKGAAYTLADGTTGELRVFKPHSHLRLTWQPPGWARPSTIQVRVIPAKNDRTTIAFHQEHLPDGGAREDRRAHFKAALDELQRLID